MEEQQSLHQWIEEQARRHPGRAAVRFEGAEWSLAELNSRANRVARYLRGLGVGPNHIVGVLMERSLEMVAALLGILKAGGAYLPLDPAHPAERLHFVLEDARVSVVLTQAAQEAKIGDFAGTMFPLDSEWAFLEEESDADLPCLTTGEDLAYVIYTSGSTGKPKGCLLPHKAICNRLRWMQDEYLLTEADRVLQKTPYTFDVSVWEFFWPLIAGACLVLARPNGHKDSRYLAELIRREGITTCHFVPSMLRFFVGQEEAKECRSLRHVFTSGEALPYDLMQEARRTLPGGLHNLYGPTEAAVDVTYWACEERADGIVPIGRPIANIEILILDEAMCEVGPGEEGELHIGGIGLAKGYLNRPELTAEKFVPHPLSAEPGARLYKTGDRARWLQDGNIEYLGRMDFQVKLRGNRIELGEIEAVLREADWIVDAAVLVQDETSADPKLVAYVVGRGEPLTARKVREYVKGRLPEYMVPNVVVPLSELPVTAHGKLDRKALPWPVSAGGGATAGATAGASISRREQVRAWLRDFLCGVLDVADVEPEEDLQALGMTYPVLVQLVESIYQEFGVSFPVEEFLQNPTLQTVADVICGDGVEAEEGGDHLVAAALESEIEVVSHAVSVPGADRLQELEDDLVRAFAEVLGVAELRAEDDLFDHGATSLTMVQMVERMSRQHGVVVPVEVFLEEPTVQAIAGYLARELGVEADVSASAGRVELEPLRAVETQAANGKNGDGGDRSRTVTEDLVAYFAELLRVDGLQAGDDLFDHGATSLTMVQAVERVQKRYGVIVPVEVFLEEPTVAAVAEFVAAGLPGEVNASNASAATITTASAWPASTHPTAIALPSVPFKNSFYQKGRFARSFTTGTIPFTTFSRFLSLFKREMVDGEPKYLHPSAGGLNPVQMYLSLQASAVEGVAAGVYYYHPEEHALYPLSDQPVNDRTVFHELDRSIFDRAGIGVFLIAQMEAIRPVYQLGSAHLATLDAGYLSQLVVSRQEEFGLGFTPVHGVDFDRIRSLFQLDAGHRFLHALVGGLADHRVSEAGTEPRKKGTAHFQRPQSEGSFASFATVDGMNRWDQVQFLTREEIDAFHANHAQIRKFAPGAVSIPLNACEMPPHDYKLRAAKRDYLAEPVTLDQLGRLLSVLKPQTVGGQAAKLVPSVSGVEAMQTYLYAKANGVEGLAEGIYRYDTVQHALVPVHTGPSKIDKTLHTPFNRRHFQKSAFNLFFIGDLSQLQAVYGEESLYYGLLEAGCWGQFLLDKQAEFGIGLCPVGDMKFDKVRDEFHLADGQVLLHSFTGGRYEMALPAGRELLEAERVDRARPVAARTREPWQQDLAIVGMSGRYAGADDLATYWQALRDGRSLIRELPEDRKALWKKESACRAGYLEGIDRFDSLLFRISPAEARTMDPQERLFLEVAWECLESAGYTADELKRTAGKVGVFIGAMWSDYQQVGAAGEAVRASAFHSSIANRVSHLFDFHGPSVAFNTSCSSALTALHYACESVKRGECDAALVGGLNVMTHPYHEEFLASIDFLSKDGEARPFSAAASGWLPGEGVGAVLVKPLEQAVQDGDSILAVIKGTAIGHSGRTVRFGAPSSAMQAESMQRALAEAGVTPDDIQYVEAAAAGASMADAAEMNAIRTVFAKEGAQSPDVWVGSVKGSIGHLESASAMSQVAKVVLQMQHGEIAATLHAQPVNPMIQLAGTGLSIVDASREWEQSEEPRRALVNAFGATGSGGHVVLEEYRAPQQIHRVQAKRSVLPLSAASEAQLVQAAERLLARLQIADDLSLADVAFTLQKGRVEMDERLAVVAGSVDEARQALARFVQGDREGEGLYRGTAAGKKTAAVSGGAEELAAQWVLGAAADWSVLHDGTERRVVLPTYPFARARHWMKDEAGQVVIAAGSIAVAEHGATEKERVSAVLVDHEAADMKSVPANTAETTNWEAYLREAFSEVSEIPVEQISSQAPLERYGINSLMITALNARLAQDVGSLPSTLFFEYQTIRELAEYLASRQMQAQRDSVAQVRSSAVASDMEIAVVGLGGRYPQARDLAQFWQHLKNGVDCITEVPKDRWDAERYDACRWGGFLEAVDAFDPLFFNISPREAEVMDPQERLFLETAWQTMEDAGYNRRSLQESLQGDVGVFVGVMYGEYPLVKESSRQPGDQSAVLSSYGSIANRVSYLLDLHGPSLAVDTLCSSSLTALHLAVESIRRGECAAAIAGGVNLSLHPSKYLLHAQMSMSSSDGRCRSFGEGGDGFVPGEGVGAVLLKPLQQAVADGDHIYGVIRATTINHGGKTNGYTVPNPVAQGDLIRAALEKAQVDPRTIGYVEAHGTGTALGDPIEIAGLVRGFGAGAGDEKPFCAIGSVKSNIGHLEGAAGISGLTKVLLQLKHRQLVPTLHARTINPNIAFEETPFYLQQELAEWPQPANGPRRAALSSFGAGGANAHVIVEEYVPPVQSGGRVEPELHAVVLSAKDEERLRAYVGEMLTALHGGELTEGDLAALAYTLQVGREPLDVRLAVLAGSLQELAEKWSRYLAGDVLVDTYFANTREHKAELAVRASEAARQVPAWWAEGDYASVLELWVKGLDVDWSPLRTGPKPRRLSLPTYPFAKERYWIPGDEGAMAAAQKQAVVSAKAESGLQGGFSAEAITQASAQANTQAQAYGQVAATTSHELLTYEEIWSEQPLDSGSTSHLRTVVCVAAQTDTRQAVQQLAGTQTKVLFVAQGLHTPASPELSLEQELKDIHESHGHVDALLDLRSLEDPASSGDHASIVHLLQAVAHSGLSVGQVVLAGRFANEEQRCSLEARIGFERSAGLAMPQVKIGTVMFAATSDQGVSQSDCIGRIWEELAAGEVRSVFYEKGNRFVPRLQPLTLQIGASLLRKGGTYWVTGGCGGIGFALAQHLAATWQANLVLTGRSALDAEKAAQLQQLEAVGGRPLYVQADVTQPTDMQAAVDAAKIRFGRLDGVFHAAGLISPHSLLQKDQDDFARVVAPKIEGTRVLDRVLEGEALDVVCYVSSVAAVLGDFGSCDYAVANRYQMARAASRNRSGQPGKTVVLLWPLWKEGGMQLEDEASTRRYLASSGQRALETAEGLEVLEHVLASGKEQVMVMSGERSQIESWLPLASSSSEQEQVQATRTSRNLEQSVERDLKGQLGRILKIREDRLDRTETLASFGVDSVMMTELAEALTREFGVGVTPALFYSQSTVEQLTAYFVSEHREVLEQRYREETADSVTAAAIGTAPKTATTATTTSSATPASTPHPTPSAPEPIAIIGMSGRFPEARNVDELWGILERGEHVVREIPSERFDWREHYAATIQAGKTNCKWMGSVPGVGEFDPQFFEISPREAEAMDPRQRLLLQEAWKALEDAGQGAKQIREGRMGMFVGVEQGDYQMLLDERTSITANNNSILASRLAYFLNLSGPVLAIDTACSSGLVALHQACVSLRGGECDTAIAAGVALVLAPESHMAMSQAGMLSEDGICYAFDRRANGMVPGEAVAAVVLKPLSQAIADGDPIYAVIRGSGINYDGRTNGITAPNGAAQAALYKQVHERHGVNPADIEYIVTHGTGTRLGDPVEVNALNEAFKGVTPGTCALTSTKTNLGHTLAASGLVSLISLVQAMRQETIPASLHGEQENEYVQWQGSPFYVNKANKPWPQQPGKRRIGAVSAFGMSGTNAHVVVESYDRAEPVRAERQPSYLLALSAKTQEALQEKIADLAAYLSDKKVTTEELAAVSVTLLDGRQMFAHRCAVVVSDVEDAVKLLREAAEPGSQSSVFRSSVPREFVGQRLLQKFADELLVKSQAVYNDADEYRDVLYALADLFCQGYDVQGRLLYAVPPRRVHLPTYPFARQWYWIKSRGKKAVHVPNSVTSATPAITEKSVASEQPTSSDSGPRPSIELLPPQDVRLHSSAQSDRVQPFVTLAPLPTTATATAVQSAAIPIAAPNETAPAAPLGSNPEAAPAPLVAAAEAAATIAVDLTALQNELTISLAEALYMQADEVDPEQPFTEMGMDSIVSVEWIRAVNRKYGLNLPATRIYDYSTLRTFAAHVAELRERAGRSAQTATTVPAAAKETTRETAPAPDLVVPPQPVVNIESLQSELASTLADTLYVPLEEIDADQPFTEMGMDSIIGVEWIRAVNRRYSINLPATIVYEHPTLREFTRFLAAKQSSRPLTIEDVLEQVHQGTLTLEQADQLIQRIQAHGATDF